MCEGRLPIVKVIQNVCIWSGLNPHTPPACRHVWHIVFIGVGARFVNKRLRRLVVLYSHVCVSMGDVDEGWVIGRC